MATVKESPTLNRETILVFLRSQKPILRSEFGVTKIALFGSYARGEQTSESDIDLAIETISPSFKKRCALKRFLESKLNKKIDICSFSGMRSFIRNSIEKELVYA